LGRGFFTGRLTFGLWAFFYFLRLHVQTTRDGRSGKDSLFGRLESGAPFITPVLTVYVISLGERQNGQAVSGAKKKLSDPEMEWRSFLIPRSVLHHFSVDDVIAIPSQAITTRPYPHLRLPPSQSLSLSFLPLPSLIKPPPPIPPTLYPSILLIYPVKLELTDIFGTGYRNVSILR